MPRLTPFRIAALALLGAASMACAQAATFANLHSFTASPDGREPRGGLIPYKGALYGTTNVGGSVDSGTIYRVDPATGNETVLHDFLGSFGGTIDGNGPEGELAVLGGVLYGTTSFGGTFNAGTVFSYDPATGQEQMIYSFGLGDDGTMPAAGLVAQGGLLYGTTSQGGAAGQGTVFSLDPASAHETLLHEFAGGADGADPFAPLAVAPGTGLLYGTTFFGGAANDGTVFSIDPLTGQEAIVHAFTGASFSGNPSAGVTVHDGVLFGTTAHGGLDKCDGGCGSVFRIVLATGVETDLYRFASKRDGDDPEGGLVYAQGKLFGTTLTGGNDDLGTLFSVDVSTGVKTTLHNFKGARDGVNPGTLLGWRGAIYGTAVSGGAAGQGTVFQFAP